MQDGTPNRFGSREWRIRAPQRLVAGVFFVCLCVFVLWSVRDLSMGTIRFMGPAMFPNVLAVLLGAAGIVLIVLSLIRDGEALQAWNWRGPIAVTLAIFLFAITIRSLGLTVAAFLALFVGGFATPEVRGREILIFSLVMTVAAIILFRYILGMSVPVLNLPGLGVDI